MKHVETDGDYLVTTERTPKFRIFDLGSGARAKDGDPMDPDAEKSIGEYEELLQKLEEGVECQRATSSGIWGADGRYRVQIHWFIIKESRTLREDTDLSEVEKPVDSKGQSFGTDGTTDADLEKLGLKVPKIDEESEDAEKTLVEDRQGAIVGPDSFPEQKSEKKK